MTESASDVFKIPLDQLRFGITFSGDEPAGLIPRHDVVADKLRQILQIIPGISIADAVAFILVPSKPLSFATDSSSAPPSSYRHTVDYYRSSDREVRVYPYDILSHIRDTEKKHEPMSLPFIWVNVQNSKRYYLDGKPDLVVDFFTSELEKNGIPVRSWGNVSSGFSDSLKLIHNGHHHQDIIDNAWRDAETTWQDYFLSLDSEQGKPRIKQRL